MSNITKIPTVLDNAAIKQEFLGYIADVEFNDASVYNTVLVLLTEINNKFKTLNNVKEFVRLLKASIESILVKESISLKKYIDFCKTYIDFCKTYEIDCILTDARVMSTKSIQSVFSQKIQKANRLEDIQFEIYQQNDELKTLNHMLKNKKFNYTVLSNKERDIISKDNLFTPNEIEDI